MITCLQILSVWTNKKIILSLKRQIVDSSKFKQFADDNFKSDKNGGKFPESAENAVVKREIARFSQCFQKNVQQTLKNKGLFEKGFIKM